MPLGLAQGKVALADSDAEWAALYDAEVARLLPAISPADLVDIQHFGSTSIAGIKAKPIIDILVGLWRFDDGPLLVESLTALGYDYVGPDMIPNDHLVRQRCCPHSPASCCGTWRRSLAARPEIPRSVESLSRIEELNTSRLKVDLAARYP